MPIKKKKSAKKKNKKATKPQKPTPKALLEPKAALALGQEPPFLGNDRAVEIACKCAATSAANLFRTLSQMGVNGIAFQQCVFGAVKAAGYSIGIDLIPDAPSSKLVDVVTVIQNAKKVTV
jgi:hypothetical protein